MRAVIDKQLYKEEVEMLHSLNKDLSKQLRITFIMKRDRQTTKVYVVYDG